MSGTELSNCRKYSSIIVDGVDRAPSRSMLRAVGFKDEDFRKPVIGVASTWSMVTPCNQHIDELAKEAGRGVDQGGNKSIIFDSLYKLNIPSMNLNALLKHIQRRGG